MTHKIDPFHDRTDKGGGSDYERKRDTKWNLPPREAIKLRGSASLWEPNYALTNNSVARWLSNARLVTPRIVSGDVAENRFAVAPLDSEWIVDCLEILQPFNNCTDEDLCFSENDEDRLTAIYEQHDKGCIPEDPAGLFDEILESVSCRCWSSDDEEDEGDGEDGESSSSSSDGEEEEEEEEEGRRDEEANSPTRREISMKRDNGQQRHNEQQGDEKPIVVSEEQKRSETPRLQTEEEKRQGEEKEEGEEEDKAAATGVCKCGRAWNGPEKLPRRVSAMWKLDSEMPVAEFMLFIPYAE